MSTLQICNGDTTVLALVGGVLVDFGDFPVNFEVKGYEY